MAVDRAVVITNIQLVKSKKLEYQIQHDTRQGTDLQYVNKQLSHKNSILVQYSTVQQIESLCIERKQKSNFKTKKLLKNQSIGAIGIIGFSIKAQEIFNKISTEAQNERFRTAILLLSRALNNSCVGAAVHRDEQSVHCHFIFPAICNDGYSVSTKIVHLGNGSYRLGGSKIQDIVAQAFFSLDIYRGTSRVIKPEGYSPEYDTIHRSVRELHYELPARIQQLKAQIFELEVQKEIYEKYLKQIPQEEVIQQLAQKEIEIKRLTEENKKLQRENEILSEKYQKALQTLEKLQKQLDFSIHFML